LTTSMCHHGLGWRWRKTDWAGEELMMFETLLFTTWNSCLITVQCIIAERKCKSLIHHFLSLFLWSIWFVFQPITHSILLQILWSVSVR
jgi:hypothetical protein